MPSVRELEQEFGLLEKTYRPNLIKMVFNPVIVGALIISGGYIIISEISSGKVDALILMGLALLLGGLLLGRVSLQQLRSTTKVFQGGVYIFGRGWHYAELTDVVENVGRMRGNVRIVQRYNFFSGDELAFAITSDLRSWQKLGESLQEHIVAANLPRLNERLEKGEVIEFKRLVIGHEMAPKPNPIAVSKEGIVLPDMTFFGWSVIQKVSTTQDQWYSTVALVRCPGRDVTFNLENSREAIIVYNLLKERVAKAKN